MVDALRECWRVLVGGGVLLDLRPVPSPALIRLIDAGEERVVCELDGSPWIPDTEAADRAVRQLVQEGRFVPARSTSFDFAFCWDDAEELLAYAGATWKGRYAEPSAAQAASIRAEFASAKSASRGLATASRIRLAAYSRSPLPPRDR